MKKSFFSTCPLLILLIVCGIGFGVISLISCKNETAEPSETQAAQSELPADTAPESAPEQTAAPETAPVQTQSPSAETQPAETGTDAEETTAAPAESVPVQTEPLPSASASGIVLPGFETEPQTEPTEAPPAEKTFTTVTEDYFSDALFIGDSRTNGLALYAPLSGADYYYKTSLNIYDVMGSSNNDISINGCSGVRSILQSGSWKKIYISFGINECGYGIDSFIDKYEEVIEEIRGYQPDAIIYIQSIMVVTASKAASATYFSNDNLRDRNRRLAELADGETVFFLEINDVYQDANGNLPDSYGSSDGAHLQPKYYSLWNEYLMSHAIVTD